MEDTISGILKETGGYSSRELKGTESGDMDRGYRIRSTGGKP
jgi:hypothetical protein